jgi:osmoprotectant transport system permease protein
LPVGLVLGHRGKGEGLAIAVGNAGRAIPELALIAFFLAYFGVGLTNATIALSILAIPPILTNTFVAVHQVDRNAVEAARGMGMTETEVVLKVELPLAAPTIMTGVRTAAINVIATATIAPLVGVVTLGDFIINRNVYGDEGVLAGAILVAVLVLVVELLLAGFQRLVTPRGLRLQRAAVPAEDFAGARTRPANDRGENRSHEHEQACPGAVRADRRRVARGRGRGVRRRR